MKILVTAGGECFETHYVDSGPADGRDGVVYHFKLQDLVKDRGLRNVSMFRSGTDRVFIENYDTRVEIVRLNTLRRAFDSGDFSFELPVVPGQYRELRLRASDFQPQKKASDETIRKFIKFGAYFLGFKRRPGPHAFVDFDCPEDLDYLGATSADIERNVWLLTDQGYLRSSAATLANPLRSAPTSKLIEEIETALEGFSPQMGASMKSRKEHSEDPHILVLISHSAKDKALAEALIELLRSGLGLRADQIRCSSVDGYRLPAGVNTDDQLRAEIKSAAVLIGLLTPNSLSSTYVLFELGARWGAGLFMIPLLAGINAEAMRGPQQALNALSCETEEQLIQRVEDVARELNLKVQSATSFLKQAKVLKSISEGIRTLRQTESSTKANAADEMEPFGPHNYFYRNGRTIGPYCPKCWQKDGKKILLPASTDYAGGKGRVCTVCSEFYVEEPRKGALTIRPHGY